MAPDAMAISANRNSFSVHHGSEFLQNSLALLQSMLLDMEAPLQGMLKALLQSMLLHMEALLQGRLVDPIHPLTETALILHYLPR